MTGTLIFILFLMNILLAFALLILYMRQNKLVEIEKRQKLALEEAEQVMAALLEEIKEENERLITRIKESRETEDKMAADIIMEKKDSVPAAEEHQVVQEAEGSLEPTEEPASVQSSASGEAEDPMPLREQVELLAEQGLTVTDIARKLNKGKTEIELLMKFK
ncbi:Swarming motility protein SwrB [Siminovitchia fortis]|uniref:Swarming motility protein SwrB n=1 Tax=Siminovitchia fortis TaxID=254758 RepID=UPI0011A7A376|nr:Swarming motility protein SwrB [Siminovitchia fortis]